MDLSRGSPPSLTVRSQVRDWLGTVVPRHIFSQLPKVMTRIEFPHFEKTVSLTFDDGPHPQSTPALLDALRELQIPATFFLIGERARRWPDLVREILADGHAIGNHSWSHIDFWKCSKRQLLVELSRCQQTLEEISAGRVHWIRPPYGHVTWTARAWAKRHGSTLVLWDVLPPDYNPGSTLLRLRRNYERHVRNGSVVCLHDNDVSAKITPQLLRMVIPKGIDAGWSFRSLSE